MAGQSTFGMILRDTRERKGIGLDEAARRLRIRPDILHAIEQNDFARMPPRGYTRNMVNAYARFLGLNPTEITSRYLDEMRSYQNGQYSRGAGSGFDMPSNNRRRARKQDSSRRAESEGRTQHESSYSRRVPYSEKTGRPIYSDRSDRNLTDDYPNYSSALQTNRSVGRARGNRTQSASRYSGGSYGTRRSGNIFASGGVSSIVNKLPFIVAVIVVIALLVFIVTSAVSCANHKDSANVSNVPISGLTDTTTSNNGNANENENTQKAAVVETAPTSVSFQFTVANGKTAYIEVYENDSSSPTIAEEITGPETQSFTVDGTLKFVTTSPSNVKLTVDGSEVTPTDNSDGIYTYTVDYTKVLTDWTAAHMNTNTNKNTNTNNANKNTNTNNTNTNNKSSN